MQRALPRCAAEQCGVFTADQAAAEGWTSHALRHAVARGRLRRLRVGAYQATDFSEVIDGMTSFEQARWEHAGPGVAAALVTDGVGASHSTAAVLHGLPLLFLPELACVSAAPWVSGRVDRVHVHRCTSEPWTVPLQWLRRTGVDRTLIDLAREHGVAAGLVATDAALHKELTKLRTLVDALDHCVRWPGIRAAREAIAFADGLSESVLESRSRFEMHRIGLPAPGLQVRIGTGSGRFVGRVDFYWDEFGVVGEADGAMKYDGSEPEALLEEKGRQSRLEDLDLQVVRWGTADLQHFDAVAGRLRRAFARGRRRPRADRAWTLLPPLRRPERG